MKIRFTHAVLALCVFPTAAVAGVPKGVWFSGGSVSESTSVYGGSIFSLPRQALGHGWAVRVSTGAGRYQYTTAGTDIIGKYLSGEAAIVHQSSGPWGWLNLSAGPRFSQTYLSPNDPGNRLRGSHIDLGIQSDGALDDSRGRLSWFGAYGLRNRSQPITRRASVVSSARQSERSTSKSGPVLQSRDSAPPALMQVSG